MMMRMMMLVRGMNIYEDDDVGWKGLMVVMGSRAAD